MSREERIEMLKKEFSEINTYNRPTYCAECGAVMVFRDWESTSARSAAPGIMTITERCAITSKCIWEPMRHRRPRLPG